MSKYREPTGRRFQLFSATGGRCFYCGIPLQPDRHWVQPAARDWLVPLSNSLLCVEHKHPRKRGGTDTAENVVAACSRCNNNKALSTLEEYRMRLALERAAMPYRFHGEKSPPARDYIVVVSPGFIRAMVKHNFGKQA